MAFISPHCLMSMFKVLVHCPPINRTTKHLAGIFLTEQQMTFCEQRYRTRFCKHSLKLRPPFVESRLHLPKLLEPFYLVLYKTLKIKQMLKNERKFSKRVFDQLMALQRAQNSNNKIKHFCLKRSQIRVTNYRTCSTEKMAPATA